MPKTIKSPTQAKRHPLFTERVIKALTSISDYDANRIDEMTMAACVNECTAGIRVFDSNNKIVAGGQKWTETGKSNLLAIRDTLTMAINLSRLIKQVGGAHKLPVDAEKMFCDSWHKLSIQTENLSDLLGDIILLKLFYLPLSKKENPYNRYGMELTIQTWEKVQDIKTAFYLAIDLQQNFKAKELVTYLRGLKIKGAKIYMPATLENEVVYLISINDKESNYYTIDWYKSTKEYLYYLDNEGGKIAVKDITGITVVTE